MRDDRGLSPGRWQARSGHHGPLNSEMLSGLACAPGVACISSRMVLSGPAFRCVADPDSGIGLLLSGEASTSRPHSELSGPGAASHLVVSFAVSFTYVLGRSVRTTQDREPRSRTLLNRGRPRPTDLESVLAAIVRRG
jgi:hypothetical protein